MSDLDLSKIDLCQFDHYSGEGCAEHTEIEVVEYSSLVIGAVIAVIIILLFVFLWRTFGLSNKIKENYRKIAVFSSSERTMALQEKQFTVSRKSKLIHWLILFSILVSGYFFDTIKLYIEEKEQAAKDQMNWNVFVDHFYGCDLGYSAIFPSLSYIGLDDSSYSRGERKVSLDDRNIFINKSKVGYVSERSAQEMIDLLSMCIKEARKGNLEVGVAVGLYYFRSGRSKEGVLWLNEEGKKGNENAYLELAKIYLDGKYAPKNERLALDAYLSAANLGNVDAQYYSGVMLEGLNVTRAYQMLSAAATQGSLASAFRLQDVAEMYNISSLEGYYWALVFHELVAKKEPVFDDLCSFGDIEEICSETYAESKIGVIPKKRYDIKSAARNLQQYEDRFSTAERMYVQDKVKQFIDIRHLGVSDNKSQKKPMRAINISHLSVPWVPIISDICAENSVSAPISSERIYKNSVESILTVTSKIASGEESQGTGVAISAHNVITNCHVIIGENAVFVFKGNKKISAKLVSADKLGDKCVLAIQEPLQNYLTKSRFEPSLEIGEEVYSIGNPQGLTASISNGLISGIREVEAKKYIQMTAPISHGSSGGALLDSRGNLLGITTASMESGQAINFAIPIGEFCE